MVALPTPQDGVEPLTLLDSIRAQRGLSKQAAMRVTMQVAASLVPGLHGAIVGLFSKADQAPAAQPEVVHAQVEAGGKDHCNLTLELARPVDLHQHALALTGPEGTTVPRVLTWSEVTAPEVSPVQLDATRAISPGSLDCPPQVLAELGAAKRVLVVGHVPPDGDCVGSAAGLGRLLAKLGKEVDVCVDAPLPGWMRNQLEAGEVKRYDRLADQEYDLVVMVDVGQADRIGGARQAVEKAPAVVIIDHHQVDPTSQELGMAPGARLARWIEPQDAAAVLVAGVAEKMGADLEPRDWPEVMAPLLTGVLTDTREFTNPGLRPETRSYFKHMLEVRGDGDLESAQARLVADPSPSMAGVLAAPAVMADEMLAPEAAPLRDRLAELGSQGYREELGPRLSLLMVPDQAMTLAEDSGRLIDARVNRIDLNDVLYARLDTVAKESDLSVMLLEQPQGIMLSIRSREPDGARLLAAHFGGGGKSHMGGAMVADTLDNVAERLRRLV